MMYVDASAAVKLIQQEAESAALAEYLRTQPVCSSALVTLELTRWAHRQSANPAVASQLAESFDIVELTAAHLRVAATFQTQHLGALDAIHLATALLCDVDAIITYDKQLATAATTAGLRVVSPA